MSSLIRRIEKRIMKAAGMRKQEFEHPNPEGDGLPPVKFRLVIDNDGNPYGSKWPYAIPRRFSMPGVPILHTHGPRGSRRVKKGRNAK